MVGEGYYKISKLKNNQTIAIYFLEEDTSRGTEFYIVLAIANKKKHIKEWINGERDLLSDKETGKCGIEGLLWAKKKIIEFEDFIVRNKKNHEVILTVYWSDKRRRNVYEYGLGKLGFKVGRRNNEECLFKKLKIN